MITIEDLQSVIEMQEREIGKLRMQLNKLQAWSDYNDLSLRELIDNLTESVDALMGKVQGAQA